MPLAEQYKEDGKKTLMRKIHLAKNNIFQAMTRNFSLALMILLLIGTIILYSKVLLGLLIILYFLDRWEIFKLINKNEISIIHKQDNEEK